MVFEFVANKLFPLILEKLDKKKSQILDKAEQVNGTNRVTCIKIKYTIYLRLSSTPHEKSRRTYIQLLDRSILKFKFLIGLFRNFSAQDVL